MMQARSGGYSNASSTSPLPLVARIRACYLPPYTKLGIHLPIVDYAEHQPRYPVPTRSLKKLIKRGSSRPTSSEPGSAILQHQGLRRATTYITAISDRNQRILQPRWRNQGQESQRPPSMQRDLPSKANQASQRPSSCCTTTILHLSNLSAASGVCWIMTNIMKTLTDNSQARGTLLASGSPTRSISTHG